MYREEEELCLHRWGYCSLWQWWILPLLLRAVGSCVYCCLLYTSIGIPYRPVGEPRMFFGIDSAMCYILYYALGAVLFPYLKEFHFHGLKPVSYTHLSPECRDT